MNRKSQIKSLPSRLPEEELEVIVQAYRDGKIEHRDSIIACHLRLAATIANRITKEQAYRGDDAEGEAFLYLIIAVEEARTALQDNNITPYIIKAIRRGIRDFILTDKIVHTSATTARRGVEFKEVEDSDAAIISIEAKQEKPTLEFEEAITLAVHNEDERRIIDLKREGFTGDKIGEILGITEGRVSQLASPIKERFFRIYA